MDKYVKWPAKKTPYQQLRAEIDKADGMLGYFPMRQLYSAKGAIDFAVANHLITVDEYCELSSECCRKINSPKYFDENQ